MLEHGATEVNNGREQERRKLVIRVAIAVGLIIVLLAALLIFEQQKDTAEPQAAQSESRPDIGVVVTSTPSTLPADVQEAIKTAPDMAQTTLASMSAPQAEPAKSEPAPVVPEGSKDPSVKPILVPQPPAAPHTGKEVHGDRLLVESPKPLPGPASPVPAAAPVAPVAAVPVNSGFIVQLGVFNTISNAEELRTKLKLAGIPSQLETRVQVGPFASKEEALKAQEKLRALGLGAGMLVAGKKP